MSRHFILSLATDQLSRGICKSKSIMEYYSVEIVNNIKQEPAKHFVLILPFEPESKDASKVKEFEISLMKFDEGWKNKAKMFESFYRCGRCCLVSRRSTHLEKHLKICKGK